MKSRPRHRARRDELFFVRRQRKATAEKFDAVLRASGLAPERAELRPGRRYHQAEGRRAALRRGRGPGVRLRPRLVGRPRRPASKA
jgi:hypothetical protein